MVTFQLQEAPHGGASPWYFEAHLQCNAEPNLKKQRPKGATFNKRLKPDMNHEIMKSWLTRVPWIFISCFYLVGNLTT